ATAPGAPVPSPSTPKTHWGLAMRADEEDQDADAHGLSVTAEVVSTPTAPMLSNPLATQRALRPLKRRVPAHRQRVLDETATAARAAALRGARPYRPVLTAADERWLSLALVIDTGPAMAMWRPLGRDLREALLGLGAFRNLRVWHLADLKTRVGVRTRPGGPVLHPSALLDPAGRQVVLVLSDCSGPAWWSGRAEPALHRWATHGPTAVVQPMAEHLWRRTAVTPVMGRARTVRPGAPNTGLRFTPYDGRGFQPPGTVPVPVLETAPDWLADWARLITATGGREQPTAVIHVGDSPRSRSAAVTAEQELPIRDRVRRFHATASPEAAELAAHVAVSVPVLPVMRLIQHRMVPGGGPAALAEVLLSGLFESVEADRGVYRFAAGARSALLETLPRSVALATADVLKQLSAEIDRRAGSGAETFRSLLLSGWRADAEDPASGVSARAFAMVSREALRLLSPRAAVLTEAAPTQDTETRQSGQGDQDAEAPAGNSGGPDVSEALSGRVVSARGTAEPDVVLVLGAVHVGLLPNSGPLPEAAVTRLLSIDPGWPVRVTRRPTPRVTSPETLASVSCSLPSASGRKVVGKGITQTHLVVVGGLALLGSSQIRVAPVPAEEGRDWRWYLDRPGLMAVPGEIDLHDVSDGVGQDRDDVPRLDLGSIIERALGEVRGRSPLLDRDVLLRTGSLRVRWIVEVVDSRSAPPAVNVVVEGPEQLTVRMAGRLDELPTMTRFCEELALHQWLLTVFSQAEDIATRLAAREPDPLAVLRRALGLLGDLWEPPLYLDTNMKTLWRALEERAALTRQFQASVARIRDRISLWEAQGRFKDRPELA
ncbi:MAG: hypothetical protein HOW97_01065, partial [Catenulispora sp.]|nr:hypothetical protein [Catenulispora sp.]